MSQLRSYFERWQRLEGERKALGDDLKELFSEAKGNGFQPKAMRAAFSIKAKAENETADDREQQALVELYLDEIDGPRAHPAPAHTREARAKVRTSESMDDTKALSAEAVALGLIWPEAHAETVRIADGVALKYGAGIVDPGTGEITEQPETATMSGVGPDLGETAAQSPHEAVTGGESAASSEGSRQPALASELADRGNASGKESVTVGETTAGERYVEATVEQRSPAIHSQPLRKTAADYRTHCLRPGACGASGLDHCFSCRQAMADQRVPA